MPSSSRSFLPFSPLLILLTLRFTRSESSKLSTPGWCCGYATPSGPSNENTQWISPAALGGPGPEEVVSGIQMSSVPVVVLLHKYIHTKNTYIVVKLIKQQGETGFRQVVCEQQHKLTCSQFFARYHCVCSCFGMPHTAYSLLVHNSEYGV